jgi:predicted regulator of Ras-like GTPase activity (Roadblock/LC7/MglB family)
MAIPVPVRASRRIIVHKDGLPVRTSKPNVLSPATIARLAAMITRCGGNLSAATPPTSENTSIGAICAART